jgi:hypothetical protein
MAYKSVGNAITSPGEGITEGTINGTNTNTNILFAKVVTNTTDKSSPLYQNSTSFKTIQFAFLKNNNNSNQSGGVAGPLFSTISSPPLLNEIVQIIPNETKKGNFEFYYIGPVNLFNNGGYNADGSIGDLDNEDNIIMGEGIDEDVLSKVRNLIPAPGDFLLEGRFGNTIRMGNSNAQTEFKGDENSPIIVIRNGQKKLESGDLEYINEDINKDCSSIYLTCKQTIPIDVISKNMQTFEGKTSTTITYDNTIIFNLSISGEDNSTQSDIKPVVDNKRDNANTSKEYREGDHDAGDDVEENVAGISDEESDQVFTPINSPKYISIQPTSDPTYT